jgi:hypothetical protein
MSGYTMRLKAPKNGQKALVPPPRNKRAHDMETEHPDDPCPNCGHTVRRPGIVIDLEAAVLPFVSLCAKCKHNFGLIGKGEP